ncbi:MAG: SGNH/GDSL hydrolase family protein [Bacilli bacterium]|nr:SGNH/GDSL hydrolase family protein [Bacilli bacterium]
MRNIKTLPDIIRFCATIGNLPTSYIESLTYEEQLLWLLDFLNKTILPTMHETIDSVEELENWFNNLDVQKEINNKLDEMAESGELEEIIASYLQSNAVISYNTLVELVASENLVSGMTVRTLGNQTYQDGDTRLYKIREIVNTDVVDGVNIVALTNYNTLIAELIKDKYINQLDRVVNRKFIFIGDSYGVHTTNRGTSWIEFVIAKLGLTLNSNAYISAEGSCGFLGDPNIQSDKTFLRKLQEAYSTVDDPNEITDIIIGGGVNDSSYNTTQITGAISTFMTYAKTNFPNAKISLGMISWAKSKTYLNAFAKLIMGYQNIRNYGGSYIEGSECCWHYNSFLYDTVHPTQNASEIIAQCIVNYINCGTGSYAYGQSVTGTLTGVNSFNLSTSFLTTEQDGNIIKISLNMVASHTGLSYTCNGTWFKVASFVNAWLTGGGTNQTPIPVYIVDTSNKVYKFMAEIKFEDNEIYLRLVEKQNNTTTDLSLTIKTVLINQVQFTLPAVGN